MADGGIGGEQAVDTRAALSSEQASVAILTEAEAHPDLHLAEIAVSRICAVVPRGHPLAQRETVALAELDGVAMVLREPIFTMALISASAGLFALPALLWFGWPAPNAWPWLAGSILLHLGYYIALAEAYRHADMGQVYPIARGSAPLLTACASLLLLREPLAPLAMLGIAILSMGVGLMAFAKAGGRHLDRTALGFALLTGALISGYTLVDGLGARAAADPHAYAAALFVIDAIPLPLFVLWTRGRGVLRSVRGLALPGLGGGGLALGSYCIAIWAMTVAPIPLVAATRETSVLFAMLISVVALKEPLLLSRTAAVIVIVAGIVAMRLA